MVCSEMLYAGAVGTWRGWRLYLQSVGLLMCSDAAECPMC
jgi:hypothetical protein